MSFGIAMWHSCLQKPDQDEWGTSLETLHRALQLEKEVNQALLELHKLATEKGDPHVSLLFWNATRLIQAIQVN